MTIIAHNAPREGAASLRDNISHKYAKRLLSLLHALSKSCFVSVQGCSHCIVKKICYLKTCSHLQNETPVCNVVLEIRLLHKDTQIKKVES